MTDYVENVSDKSVHVIAEEQRNVEAIRSLDRVYEYGNSTWRISFTNEQELANILQRLRDAGIAFASGQGWPPAEVALWLREKGLFHGIIKEVFWIGPEQPCIREK